jgi:hypothetical protein
LSCSWNPAKFPALGKKGILQVSISRVRGCE